MDVTNTLMDETADVTDDRIALARVDYAPIDEKSTLNLDKKLLATGLALVAVGLVMARSSRCNKFCKFIAKRIAFTGSSQFVKAFFA
ncbi:MAG TPA: hypothetical protein VF730_05630 [Terracidiphilus sp.]